MHFNTYGGTAAALAAELVNNGDVAAALARYTPSLPPPTPAESAEITAWARRLDAVFGEHPVERRVALVNELLDAAASRPTISTHDGQPPHLHYSGPGDGLVARVRAVTAAGLASVLCDEGGHRLGRCVSDGCGRVFVDVSKGGRRHFCSTRCANRVNAALHRARHRSSVGHRHPASRR
ncbi:MAG TPA: CGNR zinc finger domain-containing protein [Pseudonocardiaceae bacterium]